MRARWILFLIRLLNRAQERTEFLFLLVSDRESWLLCASTGSPFHEYHPYSPEWFIWCISFNASTRPLISQISQQRPLKTYLHSNSDDTSIVRLHKGLHTSFSIPYLMPCNFACRGTPSTENTVLVRLLTKTTTLIATEMDNTNVILV